MRTRKAIRYSVRSVLALTAAIAAVLSLYVESVWPQQHAVNMILQTGGSVSYNVPSKAIGLQCIPNWRTVQSGDNHFWLDCCQYVVIVDATDVGDPHEICRRLTGLPAVHTMSLTGMGFNDEDLEAISKLTEMSDLNLGQTSITDQGIKKLARLPRLELLEVPRTISDVAIEQLREDLPQCIITRSRTD